MATSKLYPTLSKFYGDMHVQHGSETDNDHSVPDARLYRKESKRHHAEIDTRTRNNNKQHLQGAPSNDFKADVLPLYPRLPSNMSDITTTGQELSLENELASRQAIPSAPPVELLDEDIIRFIEEALMDQNLHSSIDEIPAVDYSSLTLSSGVTLNETWVDDLQPDYDVSGESAETGLLNNLDKTDVKSSKDKSLDIQRNSGHSVELNIFPEGKKPEFSHNKDLRKYQQLHDRSEQSDVQAAHGRDHVHIKKELMWEKENRTAATDATRHARPSPESPEYIAWMTWRKQVNRQLATTILLRQGAHMKLQKSDLSRKHLNQRSIDFVSNVVKPGNNTSLGGKPFLMYGIPRASLSGSQKELN